MKEKILVVQGESVASEGRVIVVAQSQTEKLLLDLVESLTKKLERNSSIWEWLKVGFIVLMSFGLGCIAGHI